MTSIREHSQRSSLGNKIVLYHFDLSMFEGQTDLYLTPGDEGALSMAVSFDGQSYTPYPIMAEGYEVTTDGPLPRPKLTMANVGGIMNGIVKSNDNFRGAVVTRIVTFDRFLDGGVDEDPEAVLQRDVYIIRKLLSRDPLAWELGSAIDLADSVLPGRTIIRDFCDHTYRVWDPVSEEFDYSNATCEYDGEVYLDAKDQPCSASEDVCSRRLTGGCKARFGAAADLPFRGVPGVARYRVR